MQLFNDRKLARRFRDGQVPSKERLWYVLIGQILITIFMSTTLQNWLYEPLDIWDIAYDIISILFTVISLIILFRTNARGDNKEFIERYTCIAIPVGTQMILVSIIAMGVFIAGSMSFEINESYIDPTALIIYLAILLYFLIRFNGAIHIAASGKNNNI